MPGAMDNRDGWKESGKTVLAARLDDDDDDDDDISLQYCVSWMSRKDMRPKCVAI